MNRELRSSLAIGTAVFIAGGVLLGLEIASSRVLAPCSSATRCTSTC